MSYIRRMRRVVRMPRAKRKRRDSPADNRTVVIGIDPSLVGTAVAVVASPGIIEWAHGWTNKKAVQKRHPDRLSWFDIPDSDNLHRIHRIDLISKWVLKSVFEWASTPGYDVSVAIEGLAVSQRSNRASDLAELSGAIKLGLYNMPVPVRIYDPMTLKLAWTGNGTADKAAMVMACFRRFKVDYTVLESAGENLADATLLAQLLYHEQELRAGRKELKRLDAQLRRVMLRTTKAEPVALISRPLISRFDVSAKDPVLGDA